VRARNPRTLRELIETRCPRRALHVSRAALVNAILAEIEQWRVGEPLIGPHRDKLRQLAEIAERLLKAHERAARELRELGADREFESAIERLRALGIESPAPLSGPPAANLYTVAAGAAQALQRWERLWRARRGAPRRFGVELSRRLRSLCRLAECSEYEISALLAAISETHGLPKLSAATLTRRRERARRSATK